KDSNHIQNVNYAIEQTDKLREIYVNGLTTCLPLSCDCDCLWPGDTDLSGHVNYLDAINIFRALGYSGPSRMTPLAWSPSKVNRWVYEIPGGFNSAYADVDGNGKIEENDVNTLEAFLGRHNTCFSSSDDNCETGDDLIWIRQNNKDSVIGRTSFFRIDLLINSNEPIEGISFELDYDDSLYHNIEVSLNPVWPNGRSYDFEVDYPGRYKLIMLNTEGKDLQLEDPVILTVTLLPKKAPSFYPKKYTSLNICNANLHYSNGDMRPVSGGEVKLWMPDSTVISSSDDSIQDHVQLFPNPTDDYLEIEGLADKGSEYQINTIEGSVIGKGWIDKGRSRIDLSHVSPGLYFLLLRIDGGNAVVKKVIIH
ncbi:MAG: T9SS type A sorting domain-containing protein, partial [Saprospiraceae bacterium]|nr:T9SS type A sorting domain-containing protein [Saprospiraceae bacterium]